MQNKNVLGSPQDGATVVISHKIREGKESGYEEWLNQIRPSVQAASGHLDWNLVRPISGLTATYTVIIRFDTEENLRSWMESPHRRDHIERIRPLLDTNDKYTITSGLDFWFMPAGSGIKVPVRWKQFLITWSAIFPLSFGIPLIVVPLLQKINTAESRLITVFVATGIIVFLMTYAIMPYYTKLVRKWLFK